MPYVLYLKSSRKTFTLALRPLEQRFASEESSNGLFPVTEASFHLLPFLEYAGKLSSVYTSIHLINHDKGGGKWVKGKEEKRSNAIFEGHSRVYWFHLILPADYMLNINYGKRPDEPVSRFSTETGNFLIFIKIVAESLSLTFVSIKESGHVLLVFENSP